MEKIKNIPVIGYLLRLIVALIKLPKHVDEIYHSKKLEEERQMQSIMFREECSKKLEIIKQEYQLQGRILEEECAELRRILNNIDKSLEQSKGDVQNLVSWNSDRMHEIQTIQILVDNLQQYNRDRMSEISKLMHLQVSDDYLKQLNFLLSAHPTLWGAEDRLHISELAAVSTCFFNTNSGDITIGDYTFAGSGVSILAGSHDMKLKGLLRRDAEMIEGCDIVIGEGVWLASNCTILGPANIGDNAVIAAGAVITPGTIVPNNSIYGGVPAKKIGMIDCDSIDDNTKNSGSILAAIQRNNGVLFVDGWTEKQHSTVKGNNICGHYAVNTHLIIFTVLENVTFEYMFKDTEDYFITIDVDGMKQYSNELECSEGMFSVNISTDKCNGYEEVHTISINRNSDEGRFFLSAINNLESEKKRGDKLR